MTQNESQEDMWWRSVEEAMDIAVLGFLKNLLNIMGFSNSLSFSSFDVNQHVPEVEEFARSTLPCILNPDDDKALYYGPFAKIMLTSF